MKKEQKVVVYTLVGILALFAIGIFGYNSYKQSSMEELAQKRNSLFIRDYSAKMGPDNAKVKLVEFFDPACATCADFYPYVKALLKKHPNDIQLILRYTPFHNGADEVVKIIEASKNQGLYFETLELFLKSQRFWTINHQVVSERVWRVVNESLLDIDKLKTDMNSPQIQKILDQDMADAKELGVKKTPSYFANGKPLIKFGLKELIELVQSELQK